MLSSYRRAFRLVLTWQTGWDSNPRNACTSGGLVIRCLRPTQPPVRILQQEAPVLRNEPAVFVFLLMWLALSLMDDLASKNNQKYRILAHPYCAKPNALRPLPVFLAPNVSCCESQFGHIIWKLLG